MCALCGSLGQGHWAEAPGREARNRRESLLGQVLASFGIRLEDWGGVLYPLRAADGQLVVADNLGVLWAKAQQLADRPLDPLDPELLAALEG
jgi:hypothetical protein